jgi:hypothetical protein
VKSAPDSEGHVTVLQMVSVGETRYFGAAGYPGRTLGLWPLTRLIREMFKLETPRPQMAQAFQAI